MCGRYASTRSAADIAAEFRAVDATAEDGPAPDWNVAPTKPVLAVVRRHPRDGSGIPDPARTERSVRVMRWGLVPSWAKDPSVGSRMINARAETAAEKPAFRKALAARRCLLPADGWYEWKRADGGKQPYFVTGGAASPLAMAGVWEFWRDSGKAGGGAAAVGTVISTAVLTTAAVGPLAGLHHRMPLLLAPEDWDAWLDPDAPPADAVLRPPAEEMVARLELRPVSSRVNNVRHEGPELTERVEVAEPALALELPVDGADQVAGREPESTPKPTPNPR